MRFTSLVIELIRARPRLIVWIAVLLQAAMWLLVALAVLPQPARQPRDPAGLRPRIPGRHRSRPAVAGLARRYRLSRRRRPHVRRLRPGRTVRDRDLRHALSPRARRGRHPAGGARRAADHDGAGLLLARARLRPPGAGAAALDAAAVAFLADHRPAPRQCLVRLVDRGRPVAADHARGDLPPRAARDLRALDCRRPQDAARARSAVRGHRRRRAGVALCRLADARRNACPAGPAANLPT